MNASKYHKQDMKRENNKRKTKKGTSFAKNKE